MTSLPSHEAASNSPKRGKTKPLTKLEPESLPEAVRALYLDGNSTRQIAKKIGVSKTKVGVIVKELGISRTRSQSQLIGCAKDTRVGTDWSFLPLNAKKSWLLGLIYGDGSLRKDGYRINITSGDPDIISNVNRMFGNRLHVRNLETYQVTYIDSKRLWRQLNQNFGLVPNKSSRGLVYPESVDPVFTPHFIRGLLDSDGCWMLDTRGASHLLLFQYVSKDKSFVEEVRRRLVVFVGVSENRSVLPAGNKGFGITFSNKDAIAIGHWLYGKSDASMRCKRKYQIWREYA